MPFTWLTEVVSTTALPAGISGRKRCSVKKGALALRSKIAS
jgi:hypothetical protein